MREMPKKFFDTMHSYIRKNPEQLDRQMGQSVSGFPLSHEKLGGHTRKTTIESGEVGKATLHGNRLRATALREECLHLTLLIRG